MNMTKKIITIAIGALCASSAFALLPPGATPTSPPPGSPVGLPVSNNTNIVPVTAVTNVGSPVAAPVAASATEPSTEVTPPSDGNSYEKLVTPLLRQISQRKAQLELKKLDREIEKLDQASVKDQIDLKAEQDKASNPTPTNNAGFTPTFPPGVNPMASAQAKIDPNLLKLASGSTVKVLMTFGYSNDLYAKIASGDQGGYVVKKGDVLPDGREVVEVNPNYISVKKSASKSAKGLERIFVSGEPTPVVAGATSTNNPFGGSSVLPNGMPAPNLAPLSGASLNVLVPPKK